MLTILGKSNPNRGFCDGASRRDFLTVSAAAFGCALLRAYPASAGQSAARISTTDLGGVTLLQGAGCNVVVLSGPEGALMIDGGLAANADALLRAVYAATGNDRIHTLINTHWHPDHVGANELVGRAGGTIFAHEKTRLRLATPYYLPERDEYRQAMPVQAQPTESFYTTGSTTIGGKRVEATRVVRVCR